MSGPWPFAPQSLRVLSLTRLTEDENGDTIIRLYFELADAWGHQTKAPGVLMVQLYREGSTRGAEPELVWRTDLSEGGTNSDLFDEGTRAYRVPLGGIPGWASEGVSRGRLSVLLQTVGSDGRAVTVRDEIFVAR